MPKGGIGSVLFKAEKVDNGNSALNFVDKNADNLQRNIIEKEVKTGIKANEEFFPSLSKKMKTKNIEFVKNPEFSLASDNFRNSQNEPKFKRLSSTHRNSFNIKNYSNNENFSQFLTGDRNLYKRILYLKEILEINPHLDENKAMLREHFNEPILTPPNAEHEDEGNKIINLQLKSPKKSPRKPLNKTVVISDETVVRPTNLLAHKLKKTDVKMRRKTRTLIRKEFEDDHDISTPSIRGKQLPQDLKEFSGNLNRK